MQSTEKTAEDKDTVFLRSLLVQGKSLLIDVESKIPVGPVLVLQLQHC